MVQELKKKYIRTTMLVVTILLAVFLASVNIINYMMTRNSYRSRLDQIVAQNLRSMPGAAAGGPSDPGSETSVRGRNLGRFFVACINSDGAVTFSDLTHDADVDFDEMVALINEADVSFAPEATGQTETEPEVPSEGSIPPPDKEGKPGNDPMPDHDTESGNPASPGNDMDPGDVSMPDHGGEPGRSPAEMRTAPDSDGEAAPQEERGQTGGYLYYAARQMDGSTAYAFLDISQEKESMLRIILITAALGLALWLLILVLVVFLSKKAIVPIAENIEKQRLFITNAGHEFKTPLAVIVSNVDVQELHGGKTKWLENIRAQALRLSDLTRQMLTLAKMEESGTSAFTSTTFNASEMLEDTIRIFKESASLRGIRIRTDIEAGVMIHFPKDQYQQMLELLLDNAVKYAKENGLLSIALGTERRVLRLVFRNDCEMLPDVDPEQLFDRFYRPDSSRNRNLGGSGIGLAVVRAIAQQGGGSAKAHFLPDQVIEFVIELPRKN